MVAINHALTGALIGFSVVNPVIALPLAIASHFMLDSLPHFGVDQHSNKWFTSKIFIGMLTIDALLCVSLVGLLATAHPTNWLLAAVCAFLATSPDFLHFNHFYKVHLKLPWKPNIYSRFASRIQWFEHPSGAVVEVAWFGGMIFLLASYI